MKKNELMKLSNWLWEIPKTFRSDMKTSARVYATETMLEEILNDRSLEQLVNVATLPGIRGSALAMPDAHEGYGFPIGGVAAFDPKEGIISPGGIGYDINCGVRLLRSDRSYAELKKDMEPLARSICRSVPSGVGRGGDFVFKGKEMDRILEGGAGYAVKNGYGTERDLRRIESSGTLENADASLVSEKAKARGRDQLGTMGAGNHFVEMQTVEVLFDAEEARKLGLFHGQVVVMIHMGSRGLGHQIATDYIRVMSRVMEKYDISVPDRELACAPFSSREGQDYFSAMSAGANFAWANRQFITWEIRNAWSKMFGAEGGNLEIVYDVAHNIAKIEEHEIDGIKKEVVVHRKGATRAFPGQPVIIPGSMGTGSYLLVGQEKAMQESFGSTCHGAGRRMSRTQAKKEVQGKELKRNLEQKGIVVESGSLSSLAEEAPFAYKNIDEVVEVVHQAGIAKKVARLRPVAVIKG